MEDGPFWRKGKNCFFLGNKKWIGWKRIKDMSGETVSWILDYISVLPRKNFLGSTETQSRTQARRSCHRFLKNLDDYFHSGSSEIKFSPLWCIFSILYWILNSNWSPWIYFHIALDSGTIFQGAMCLMVEAKRVYRPKAHTVCHTWQAGF